MSRRESWVVCPVCRRRVFRVTNGRDYSWGLDHLTMMDRVQLPGVVFADGARWDGDGPEFRCPRGHYFNPEE